MQAVKLNTDGVKAPARSETKPKKAVAVPPYFATALKKNKPALAVFEKLSPSHKREYVEWISGAKREETRVTRLEKALKLLVDKKSLHWKYR